MEHKNKKKEKLRENTFNDEHRKAMRKMRSFFENIQHSRYWYELSLTSIPRFTAGFFFICYTDDFWKDINEELQIKGKAGKLVPAKEPRDIHGGFILLAEGVEINCSFEALLTMKRDELEPKVAAVLFS